jgi:hypothetical protein
LDVDMEALRPGCKDDGAGTAPHSKADSFCTFRTT